MNFSRGKQLDLIDVARELIENSSNGLRFSEDEQIEGITAISVDLYHFNSKTLYFDVNCNHFLKEQRNAEKQKKLKNQNLQAESKVLKLTEDDISNNVAYKIKYLEKNKNTAEQETRSKLIFGNRLFCDEESDYEIVEINPLEIEDGNMYALSDFSNRANGKNYEDERIIDLGNFQKAVTGYSLKQMLEENMTFPTLMIAEPKTIELAKEFVQKNISKVIHIFSGEDTDWSESIKRMETDEQRIDIERRTQSWGDPSMS